jgi:hypothetical protein
MTSPAIAQAISAAANSEVETKFELEEDGFQRLFLAARVEKTVHQRNVYYDQGGRLARLAATCRLRLSDGEDATFTIKFPVSWHGGQRTANEFEVVISQATARSLPKRLDVNSDLPPRLAQPLLSLGVTELCCWGESENWRTSAFVEGRGRVELDRLALPDGETVYEAEIETPDQRTHEELSNWIWGLVPSARHSTISKSQRLLAAIRSLSQGEPAASNRVGDNNSASPARAEVTR